MPYSIDYLANLINQNKTSNPALAAALFGGAGSTEAGGALGVALRNMWGPDAAKQWINQSELDYKGGFDFKTGKWGVQGKNGLEQGTLAGWDPSQWNAGAASKDYLAGLTSGATKMNYDPTKQAGAFAGQTGVGVGADGKTPLRADGTDPSTEKIAAHFGGSGAGAYAGTSMAKPAAAGGATAGGAYSNTGASGGLPTADPATYSGGTTPTYTALQRSAAIGSPMDFYDDEGYKFRKQQGMDGIQNAAAARGGLNSGQTLKDLASFNSGLASQEYQNAYGRWQDARNFGEDQYRYDTGQNRHNYEYGNEDQYRRDTDARNYNNANYWNALGFNEDQRRNTRDFDYSQYVNDRNYQTGLDQWNQQFGYNAANNDRSYQGQLLTQLAQMGLTGSQNNGQLATALAAIFGNNTMTGAGAGAQGAVGQANNWTQLLNALLGFGSGLYGTNQVKP